MKRTIVAYFMLQGLFSAGSAGQKRKELMKRDSSSSSTKSNKVKNENYAKHSNEADEELHYRKKNKCNGEQNQSNYAKNIPFGYNRSNPNQGRPLVPMVGGFPSGYPGQGFYPGVPPYYPAPGMFYSPSQQNPNCKLEKSMVQNETTFFQWMEYMKLYQELAAAKENVRVVRLKNNKGRRRRRLPEGMADELKKLCRRSTAPTKTESRFCTVSPSSVDVPSSPEAPFSAPKKPSPDWEESDECHEVIMDELRRAESKLLSVEERLKSEEGGNKTIKEQVLLLMGMISGDLSDYIERIHDLGEEEAELFGVEVARAEARLEKESRKTKKEALKGLKDIARKYLGYEKEKKKKVLRLQRLRERLIGIATEKIRGMSEWETKEPSSYEAENKDGKSNWLFE